MSFLLLLFPFLFFSLLTNQKTVEKVGLFLLKNWAVVLCRCPSCVEDYHSNKFHFLATLGKEEEDEEDKGGKEEIEEEESLFSAGGRKRGRGEEGSVSLYASAEKAFAETDSLNNTDKLKMIEGYR